MSTLFNDICFGLNFVDRVQLWWPSYQFHGTPSFILASKLKALKKDLKLWNEQVLCNMDTKKKSLMTKLQGLEDEERRDLSIVEKI